MLNNVHYDLLRDESCTSPGVKEETYKKMSISIISVLNGIGTGHLPIQCRSVPSCTNPLGSKVSVAG
jgi:hypothetical protein